VDGGEINGIMAPTGFVPLDRMNLFFRPPRTNERDVPPDPRDPLEGEPLPTNTPHTEVGSGESRELVKSLIFPEGTEEQYDAAREGMMTLLRAGENPTRRDIVKSLTYMTEAGDIEPEFAKITHLLRKCK